MRQRSTISRAFWTSQRGPVPAHNFGHMFDGVLPEIDQLAGLDVPGLVDAAAGWSRAENAACARKLAVLAEIFTRRTGLADDERDGWWIDPEAALSAELGAALTVGRGLALA